MESCYGHCRASGMSLAWPCPGTSLQSMFAHFTWGDPKASGSNPTFLCQLRVSPFSRSLRVSNKRFRTGLSNNAPTDSPCQVTAFKPFFAGGVGKPRLTKIEVNLTGEAGTGRLEIMLGAVCPLRIPPMPKPTPTTPPPLATQNLTGN